MPENADSIKITGKNPKSLDGQIAAVLRGEHYPGQLPLSENEVHALFQRICFHGVECLLYADKTALAQLPASLEPRLQALARSYALRELRQRQLLQTLCEAFAAEGVDLLVFKGAAVAYTLYENPVHRTRSDIDLLVRPEDRFRAQALLAALGYTSEDPDTVVTYIESAWWVEAPEGGQHHIDLHWQLNNSALLASLYSFDELYQRSVLLPVYGQAARTPGYCDTLLIACLHRKAHNGVAYTVNGETYTSGERLIWLCDIDKLARLILPAQWSDFVQITVEKGALSTFCETLAQAVALLGTPLPQSWLKDTALNTACAGQSVQRVETVVVARFLSGKAPSRPGLADRYFAAGVIRRFWLDLHGYTGSKAKLRFMRTLFFPGAGYMYSKYHDSDAWLPWLYVRRIICGLYNSLAGQQRQ